MAFASPDIANSFRRNPSSIFLPLKVTGIFPRPVASTSIVAVVVPSA